MVFIFKTVFRDKKPCPVSVQSWWVQWMADLVGDASYMWTTGLGPALLSVALSAPCPSTVLQLYQEAPLLQKVGAGSLMGAKGQAGTALHRANGSICGTQVAFHFLPSYDVSLQPPFVPPSLQVIFTTG